MTNILSRMFAPLKKGANTYNLIVCFNKDIKSVRIIGSLGNTKVCFIEEYDLPCDGFTVDFYNQLSGALKNAYQKHVNRQCNIYCVLPDFALSADYFVLPNVKKLNQKAILKSSIFGTFNDVDNLIFHYKFISKQGENSIYSVVAANKNIIENLYQTLAKYGKVKAITTTALCACAPVFRTTQQKSFVVINVFKDYATLSVCENGVAIISVRIGCGNFPQGEVHSAEEAHTVKEAHTAEILKNSAYSAAEFVKAKHGVTIKNVYVNAPVNFSNYFNEKGDGLNFVHVKTKESESILNIICGAIYSANFKEQTF